MRIIAGRHRGARLLAPRGTVSRPMLDRVRTALFDVLGPLEGARVLDLFAGTGSLGLEALSRGAASCVFVESSAAALEALRSNVERLRPGERARVVRAEAIAFAGRVEDRFDLVFFDPPYAMLRGSRRPRTLEALASIRRSLLRPGGRAILHAPRDLLAAEEVALVGAADARAWGTSALFVFGASG